jgi:hypothetical protein
MSIVGEIVEKLEGAILRLWERGENFFWAVALAGAAAFLILLAGWWLSIGNGAELFNAYGWIALIVAIGGAIFAALRKLDDRKPTVFLIADEGQSFWSQSRQGDGRVTTQFCFRMQATNLTNDPVRLSAFRLITPRIKHSDNEIARHVLTEHPTRNSYGSEFAIMPRAIASASCDLIVDRAIGKPGATVTAVVAVSDQRGRWHKVRFQKLRGLNQGPV